MFYGKMGNGGRERLREALQTLQEVCGPIYAADNLIGLQRSAGFREEGIARGYLCINGNWEDHILFAKLASDAP